MKSSPFILRITVALVALGALAVLRFKPWKSTGDIAEADRETLTVGFLPVTCHLTCPVTDFASKTSSTTRFVSQRYADFPSMVEAFKAGRLQACFFIAPLAMKLREQGFPAKIAYLGHRDGSTIMVRSDNPATSLRDLRGKRFGIPSKYSNQYLVLTKLMEDQGLTRSDFDFLELPPPDMPGALAVGAIEAFFIGEPHAARAELDGTGRILYHIKDIWPNFISCVLVVNESLIQDRPQIVRDLVRGIAESGEWAERNRLDAAALVAPYFRQDEKVVRHVLTTPPDRVSYRMLTPTEAEFQRIADMALAAGILDKPMDVTGLIDRSFIPTEIPPARIDLAGKNSP